MASTYSNLKIQHMATGENSGTWGNVTNANLGDAIEQAIVETATVTFASNNVTLTLSDSNSRQDARALRLNLTGTTAGARDLIVPAIQKPYLVNNGTADTITVKVSGQTGVAVPASTSMLLYNNGTDVVVAFNRVVAEVVGNVTGNVTGTASNATVLQTARTIAISGNVTGTATSFDGSGNISIDATAVNADGITSGTLAVARGGTGATTLNSEAVVIGNATGAVKFVAPGTDGNVLTSNGTAWISEAISAGGNYVAQTFTGPSSGTWTKPAGLKAIRVTLVAGAGGGGSGGNSPTQFGGAGGGGGYSAEYIPAPSIPGPQPYTAGGGGAGGSGFDATGATGGSSSFGSPAFLSATGGAGGQAANAGGAGGGGGSGSGGNINYSGAKGVPRAADGTAPFSGGIGAGGFGFGGLGTQGPGSNTGSAGFVIVEEFY